MSSALSLLLALSGGLVVGVVYWGGLWLTVQRVRTSRAPALLLVGSCLGRLLVLLVVLYLVTPGGWQRLAAFLVGFFTWRFILTWRHGWSTTDAEEGGRDAPES